MNNLAPIVLFVYNRLDHTRRTIEALQKNHLASQSHLYIYSDGAKDDSGKKKVQDVRNFINAVTGFANVTVVERNKNWGLANSIIDGVSTIIQQHGKIIVIEDDLVTSPHFLRFMNDGLTLYQYDENVASIHGYIYPLKEHPQLPDYFFIQGADCWGWATWQRAWNHFNHDGQSLLNQLNQMDKETQLKFDFSGHYHYKKMLAEQVEKKIDSWAIRWYASAFLANMVTLYPATSFVLNIGNDQTGIHCSKSSTFDSKLAQEYFIPEYTISKESFLARALFENYFMSIKKSSIEKITSTIKRFLSIHEAI